jgi:16S rRNA (guanine527-N7)-methyltransferase
MVDALNTQLHALFDSLAPQLSFDISQAQQTKLIDFVLLLHKWNKAYNLSSVRDPEQMLIKHIFDSIVVKPHLIGNRFADIGTGPGLPGIPLAILCEDKQFTLIDSLGKRIRFIKQALHELDINNVTPIQSRVENVQDEAIFDGVLSRAFASLNDMLHWCEHLTDSSGEFLALKGQLHHDEINQIPAQFTLVQSIPLLIPSMTGERHIIKIKKL